MFYKNSLGILLATLVVVLLIPNLSVVHAEEDEDEEEDEYGDEVIPPYRDPRIDHYRYGWEEVESIQVAMMGEYDTSWGIPEWVTEMIEKYTRKNNDIAHKEPCRVQSNWTIYRNRANEWEISKTEWVTERKRRGFFATFKDPSQWVYAMSAYFIFDVVVYVDSEMKEENSTIGCSHKFLVLNTSSEYVKQSANAFRDAPALFDQDWTNYHLFERNCQHYND